jgi:gamma-glutamylcyclotransferase (GGCT)/AIG2-like uncharacterized protein YtfP
MGIEKVNTPDGVKLRDSKTKQLKGSIGPGATAVPTASPALPTLPAGVAADDVAADQALLYTERLNALQARQRVKDVVESAAYDLGTTPEYVRQLLNDYRTALPSAFDDVEVPDPAFRYHEDSRLVPDPEASPDLARAWRKLGYEQYLAQPHPVFVYGTLRPGQGNHGVMAHGVDHENPPVTARMDGVAIYGAHRGFPYAAEHDDPTACTVGEIVWLTDTDNGWDARLGMDHLEGFSSDHPSKSHYERVLRPITITDPDGSTRTVNAWTYLARGWSKSQLREDDRILDGDWVKAKNAYRAPRPRYDMGESRNFHDDPWII